MRQFLLFSLVACLISPAMADADKSKHCPKLQEIHLVEPKLYRYYFYSVNEDGNYFVSEEYESDENNGPAFPLAFSSFKYNPESKKLSCIYIAFSMNGNPTLVNVGDY